MAGPFYFAWVDPGATTFGAEHQVEDEEIVSASLDHTEGNIPTLTIEIRNPRIGLLNAGRKLWAWLSWFDGSSVVPLFFGRLVGVPSNIFAEIVSLAFVARPLDYEAQKQALAETLKVAPYYDPIFIDAAKRDDPDTILEGYSALWHVDRTTLAVTISDVLVGEDGLESFTEADVPYDSVTMTLGQAPLTAVKVDASVAWTQSVNITNAPAIDFGTRTWRTMSGASLLADWPKPGASIGGGWTVASSFATDVYGIDNTQMYSNQYEWHNLAAEHEDGDALSTSLSISVPMLASPVMEVPIIHDFSTGFLDPDTGLNIPLRDKTETLYIPEWLIITGLSLTYGTSGTGRSEHVVFTLQSDLQAILSQPESSQQETIAISGSDVGVAIAGVLPIGDLGRRTYFPTDRGLQSIEYLLCLARAHLRARARAVHISFDCRVERATAFSCRKNAILYDHRFPGGQALGKITAYSIKLDGDSGTLIGNVTIECAVGEGGTVTASAGTPSYVANGYTATGYQSYQSSTVVVAGDLGFSPPIDALAAGELQFPLTKDQVVVSETVHGSLADQVAAIEAVLPAIIEAANIRDQVNPSPDDLRLATALGAFTVDTALHDHAIWYDLELRSVDNLKFNNAYDITTVNLVIPKQIDLEAASLP